MSKHTDLSTVPVNTAPSPATSGTTLKVTDANAALLPDVFPFWATVKLVGAKPTRSNSEIIQVTGASSSAGLTTYTIVRAQGLPATTARSIVVGDDIFECHTAQQQIDTELEKADDADVDTGTDDAKFVTALALAGSLLMRFDQTRFKVGSLTRAQDAADGSVATTGVGFQPKAIIFFWGVDSVAGGGVGFSDGTNHFASSKATNNTQRVQTTYVIETLDGGSWDEKGALSSFDSDGFTIAWTKGGSPPSASIEIGYIAFR